MYTLTSGAIVIRDADGAHIPADPRNADYAAYQAWVAAGNAATPAPAVAPAPVRLDFLAFMALFTPAEQAALVASTDPKIKLFLLMASGAGTLSLADPTVMADVGYCATAGVLTGARASQILANAPAPAS